MVISLGDGIFRSKPKVPFPIKRIPEAGMSKVIDGYIGIMHPLQNAPAFEFLYCFFCDFNSYLNLDKGGLGSDRLLSVECWVGNLPAIRQ